MKKKNILHQLQTTGTPLDGMCYVLQCDDGSTIVVDGGMDNGDAEILLAYLKKLSGDKKPVIDLWILTHAHPDHTFACKGMGARHADELTVKKLCYRFPSLEFRTLRDPGTVRECEAFEKAVANFKGAEIYTPSAGDRFTFGSVTIDILFTYADLPSLVEVPSQGTNDTSTVFRVTCEGQTILFLGDVEAAADRVMIDRYGHALKSDVCQVAHHGSFSSTVEFYNFVDPEVLLWPVRADRQEKQLTLVPASRHLLGPKMHVKDVYLAGHGTVAIELPVSVRKTPFLPSVPVVPDKERKGRIRIPRAPEQWIPLSPEDPFWQELAYRPVDGMTHRTPPPIFYKIAWNSEYLSFAVRVEKPFISDPERYSCGNCDCVRLDLTETAVTDPFLSWDEISNEKGAFANLKFFPEKKKLPKGEASCTDSELGECICVFEENAYTMYCRVKLALPHRAGDVMALNLEIDGINTYKQPRDFCQNLLTIEDGGRHLRLPSSLCFVTLE